MHCLPRNPAFHITIAHYDYHIVVTKTTLIRAQSKALESKETAEESAYTLLFNFKLYDHIVVFSEMTILFSAQDGWWLMMRYLVFSFLSSVCHSVLCLKLFCKNSIIYSLAFSHLSSITASWKKKKRDTFTCALSKELANMGQSDKQFSFILVVLVLYRSSASTEFIGSCELWNRFMILSKFGCTFPRTAKATHMMHMTTFVKDQLHSLEAV